MTGSPAAKCAQLDCFYPESGCDLGHAPGTCPVWSGGEAEAGGMSPGEGEDLLMPWSGSALGLADVQFVAARSRPTVVGIVGPHNAGKTTLLGAWYLLLSRGQATGPSRRFAGSFSLAGWEAIAASLRWAPGQRPGFPPHTSSRAGRAPGLLHLAFRPGGRPERSYLFTDAPGEWFQKWAANRAAPEAAGARWVAEHADLFLFVADREALAGEDRGVARGILRTLAARVAAERDGRPVALVWTKADVALDATVEGDVRNAVMRSIPDAAEFHVSVEPDPEGAAGTGRGLTALLQWVLEAKRRAITLPPPAARGGDPLFLVGAR